VGHVDEIANDGRTLKLSGVVSAATAAAAEFLNSADSGFPWSVSIEGSLSEPRLEQHVVVNGRHYPQVYVVRNAQLSGLAFVTTGADPSARGLAATFHSGSSSMSVSASEQTKILARVEGIQLKCSGAFQGRLNETKERALAGELDALSFEREVEHIVASDAELHELRASRTQTGSIRTTNHGAMNDSRVLTAAFCLAGGLADVENQFPEQVLDAAYGMRRHVGLQSLLMRAACENGYQAAHAETIHAGNLRQVLRAAFTPDLRAAASWSTLDIGGILSNTGNKFLLDGWNETSGDEWRRISEPKPVKDFKTNTFYRLLESAEYEKIAPGAMLTHGTLGQQSMTVKADTYGRMYGIERTQIINDDLDALTDVPRRLGRAAGMKFRRIFWGSFLAGDNFFSAGNGNVLTGSGTALGADGVALQNALTAFRGMRTSVADGRKLIGGKPATLMVPPELEIVARKLLTSTGIVATGDTDTTMPNGNPFQGLAELVVVDWLSDEDLTGNSAAKWYLLRSPKIAPAMLVAFLNGNQSPTVETADADFNVLGILMRGYHDFGVGRGEPLCGLQVAGTA
jgi:hypothetical protein